MDNDLLMKEIALWALKNRYEEVYDHLDMCDVDLVLLKIALDKELNPE